MSMLYPSSVYGTASDLIPALVTVPPVDYTSRDYASIVNVLVELIPTYLPEWTDRSPGDFGIVLIELFAYMGDILNYYSDRIANEAFIATAQQRQSVLNIANLLDYTPHGNVSATTTLQFSITQPSPPVLIPANTQVATSLNGVQSIIFETLQDLWIFGDKVSTVLNAVSNGSAGQQFKLGDPTVSYPTYVFNGSQNQTVTVGGVAWTWSATNSFAGVAPTATQYIIVNGNTVVFGNGVNGAIPANAAAIVITYQPAAPANYTGSTSAAHGYSVTGETIGISSGAANQQYNLFQTPVVDNSVVINVNEGLGPRAWTYYQRLIDAYSTDIAFTLSTNANGVVSVIFGDGVNGRIPNPGAAITATYLVGGGVIGNVAAHTLTNLNTGVQGVLSVTNPQASSGGADAETLDHIRIHAPLSITAINRAVALDDYAALVLNIPSVAKAAAVATFYNAVNIYIHPAGDFFSDAPTLQGRVNALIPAITNSNLTGYMDDKKMITVSIQVLAPQYNKLGVLQTGYVPIDITATIEVLPQYHNSTVQQAALAAVRNLLLFSMVDFGFRITISQVYRAIQSTEGVDYCGVTVLCRGEITPQTLADVQCLPYEIPIASNIVITANGGITF